MSLGQQFFKPLPKLKIRKDGKEAVTSWNKTTINIDFRTNNGAVICGSKNNIIVLDIDLKKPESKLADGFDEFNKYLSAFKPIETLTVKTPSGGMHYYFNYNHSDERTTYLIKNYLKNRSGYRNASIDIRTEGCYILIPGSSINGKEYEIINDTELI